MNTARLPNETETEYIYRICCNKDEIGSWIDIAEILNRELGYDYTECKYRKDFNSFQKIFDANKERLVGDGYEKSIREQIAELKKERAKLQTEKLEYNKWLRENARDELITEKLIDAIKSLDPIEVPEHHTRLNEVGKDWLLCFGDEHYGAEFEIKGLFGETLNKYDPEVFEQRMWKLLDCVIDIVQKENIGILNVFSLGDFTDGVLRVGQLMKLRYGVVDATVKYMEFISHWISELTRFCYVRFFMVNGNHSELRMFNQPKSAFKDENMGKVVSAYIKARLEDNDNFEFVDSTNDCVFANIAGYNIVGIHGEPKDMEKAIKDLSNVYDVRIDYLVGGHLHHGEFKSTGIDKGIIRVPSIVGVDDFAMSLNKINAPGAIMIGFEEEHGKAMEYDIDLK